MGAGSSVSLPHAGVDGSGGLCRVESFYSLDSGEPTQVGREMVGLASASELDAAVVATEALVTDAAVMAKEAFAAGLQLQTCPFQTATNSSSASSIVSEYMDLQGQEELWTRFANGVIGVPQSGPVDVAIAADHSVLHRHPRQLQVAAVGALGGAVTLGAGGGTAGLLTGSMVGAICGMVPALLTLGISIPVGAVVGGGAGLLVGTTVGSTIGLVGGGTAGYTFANKYCSDSVETPAPLDQFEH